MTLIETDKTGLCFMGDLHGEFKTLGGLMKRTEFANTTYVVCGDCGFGFEKKAYYEQTFNSLSKTAGKYSSDVIFMRGNHDDPSYFDGTAINREHFVAVPDYTVL